MLTHFQRVTADFKKHQRELRAYVEERVAAGDDLGVIFEEKFQEASQSVRLTPVQIANYAHVVGYEIVRAALQGMDDPGYRTAIVKIFDIFNSRTMRMLCMTKELQATQLNLFYQMAMYDLHRKVYEVSPGLAVELQNTELRGLTVEELQLPFRAIYIVVPEEAGLQVYNGESGWHALQGVYICEDIDLETGVRLWRILGAGAPKPVILENAVEKYEWDNDAVIHFRIEFPKDALLDLALAHMDDVFATEVAKEDVAFGEMMDEWKRIFRFSMNTILYATMPDADVERYIPDPELATLWRRYRTTKKSSTKKKLKERLKGVDLHERLLLGSKTKLDRRMAEASTRGTGEGQKLRVRFLRAGHWRNQRYGKGRELVKRIRIQPHWVGGKDLPLAGDKTYVVDRKPDETEADSNHA